jgi:hypothetical protein
MTFQRLIGAVLRTLLLMALLYCIFLLVYFLVTVIGSIGGESEVWVPGYRWILNSRNIPDPSINDLSVYGTLSDTAFRKSDILCFVIPNILIFLWIFIGEIKRPWSLLKDCGFLM